MRESERAMAIRIAAIEVSHWHSIYDPAYLRQLARMPDAALVALQDPDAAVAAARAAVVGNPATFTDYKRMLRETKPDFVLVLGRHSRMPEVAHHLLDEGFPFLIEKPVGLSATQVLRVVDKADAKGAFVAVPLPQRYSPFLAQARAMLADGAFGPLSHVYMRTTRFTSARYAAWDSGWMLEPEHSGGGCLRNLGIHGIDLFLILTGEDAEVTGAQISARALGQRVEDYASVLLRSRDGVLGTLDVGNAYPRRTHEGTRTGPSPDRLLDGADGEWKLCGRDALLSAKDGALRIVTADEEKTISGLPTGNPSYRVLEDALAHWQRGEPPPASVRDCYRAARLVDRAYAMAGELA
jgi:predicted dehydrogenase